MTASATVRENPIELLEPRSHSVVVTTADDNWACDEVIE